MEYNYLPAELPTRAWDAYKDYKGKSEVSLLLSVAWAVFVVPTERLDLLGKEHHSGDSKGKNGTAEEIVNSWASKKSSVVDILKKLEGIHTFADRSALPPAGSSDWFSKVREGNLCSSPKYGDLLSILRHGLSHGNVWTDNMQSIIKNICIANYPLNILKPVQVIYITECTLRNVAEDFVKWYKKSIDNADQKVLIASQDIPSDANPGATTSGSAAQ